VRDPGECPLLLFPCGGLPLVLTVEIFICLQEVGWHKPSRPRVPEDAVDRAARRVAAEEKKKKDAEKARARERTRARDALEKLHRRQERDGLPREPSPETPDDDDDDEDDDEDDDMVVGAKAETPPFARSLRWLAAALTETKQAGAPFA
jgi:hypothetical protein